VKQYFLIRQKVESKKDFRCSP